MWKLWKSKRQAQKQGVCSGKFNLGFGNPRQDTRSFCVSKVAEMRKRTCAAKQALITELRLHKLRAKKFFQLLKHPLDAETITVSFDMQQNQPLPKLSIGEVFYGRQVWLYNLTVAV